MTALAARRMGYRISTLDPAGDAAPAAPVCDRVVRGAYDDLHALEDFARGLDVASFEFENIPPASVQLVGKHCPIHPRWQALEICQHREREKNFLHAHGYPHAAFRVVTTPAELADAMDALGVPCVLKTAQSGYDGKGQLKITPAPTPPTPGKSGAAAQPRRGVLEAWMEFDAELSVICARNGRGQLMPFPVFENIHTRHILDVTICPARFAPGYCARQWHWHRRSRKRSTCRACWRWRCFSRVRARSWSMNSRPRPHNSGHLTFDACLTSQFEQHARAVCDLPLGRVDLLRPAVMVNLLGDLWPSGGGMPDWSPVLEEPAAKLHLYGKVSAKPARKMGHFCVLDESVKAALEKARAIKARLLSEL